MTKECNEKVCSDEKCRDRRRKSNCMMSVVEHLKIAETALEQAEITAAGIFPEISEKISNIITEHMKDLKLYVQKYVEEEMESDFGKRTKTVEVGVGGLGDLKDLFRKIGLGDVVDDIEARQNAKKDDGVRH